MRADGVAVPPASTTAEVLADPENHPDVAAAESAVLIPLMLDAGRTVRANVTFDAGLLEAIDAEAKRRRLLPFWPVRPARRSRHGADRPNECENSRLELPHRGANVTQSPRRRAVESVAEQREPTALTVFFSQRNGGMRLQRGMRLHPSQPPGPGSRRVVIANPPSSNAVVIWFSPVELPHLTHESAPMALKHAEASFCSDANSFKVCARSWLVSNTRRRALRFSSTDLWRTYISSTQKN
jgi:hypothetical protein